MPRTVVVPPEESRTAELVLEPPDTQQKLQDWIDFFDSLPAGTRSKEDIDRQIEDDRSSK